MKANEQIIQQIERAIRKIAQKFPSIEEASVLTDIHLRVSQESGELRAFNDDEHEITRCVIAQWIDNKDEDFYDDVTILLREILKRLHEIVDGMGILKPFNFILEDDDKECVAELYVADDETMIIGADLMKNLDKDLDAFFNKLMENN